MSKRIDKDEYEAEQGRVKKADEFSNKLARFKGENPKLYPRYEVLYHDNGRCRTTNDKAQALLWATRHQAGASVFDVHNEHRCIWKR